VQTAAIRKTGDEVGILARIAVWGDPAKR